MLAWDRLLETVICNEATELWLVPGQSPLIRVDERLRELQAPAPGAAEVEALWRQVAPPEARAERLRRRYAEFTFRYGQTPFSAVMIDSPAGGVALVRPGGGGATHVAAH